jgi:hypothetical protein
MRQREHRLDEAGVYSFADVSVGSVGVVGESFRASA